MHTNPSHFLTVKSIYKYIAQLSLIFDMLSLLNLLYGQYSRSVLKYKVYVYEA